MTGPPSRAWRPGSSPACGMWPPSPPDRTPTARSTPTAVSRAGAGAPRPRPTTWWRDASPACGTWCRWRWDGVRCARCTPGARCRAGCSPTWSGPGPWRASAMRSPSRWGIAASVPCTGTVACRAGAPTTPPGSWATAPPSRGPPPPVCRVSTGRLRSPPARPRGRGRATPVPWRQAARCGAGAPTGSANSVTARSSPGRCPCRC